MVKYLLAVCLFLCLSTSAQNLITNGSFESALSGWVPFTTDTPHTTIWVDNTTSAGGSHSLAMTVHDTTVVTAGALQNITVIPGHHYLLSVSVRTDSVTGGVAEPYINLGDTVLLFEYGIVPSIGDQAWRQLQSRIIAPPHVTTLTLFFFLQALSGTAHFDVASLTDLDSTVSTFSVQLDSVTGTIRPFLSTNVGPLNGSSAVNLTPQFQVLGISDVRTHDYYGPCDLHTIFPDSTRNPLDSTAYHFGSTDSVVNAIIACGANVYFRLGESYYLPMLYGNPPANFNKTAQVFVQIIKHYNAGWDRGFHDGIKEWEVWNEPDGTFFWNGTPQSYAHFYHIVASAIRAYDPTLSVGGPAVASLYSSDFLSTFLDTVSTYHVPFDFFAYHCYYIANPYHYVLYDSLAATWLSRYGLSSTKRYLTEWNNYAYSASDDTAIWRNDPFMAASLVSTITYLQQTTLAKAFHYRTNEFYFGIFDQNGNYTYPGLGYSTLTDFIRQSGKLLSSGGDSVGKTILAGKNPNGDSLSILIADNSSHSNSYNLAINGMTATDSFNYQIYRIDSTHRYLLYLTGGISAVKDAIPVPCTPPFIDQIRMQHITKPAGINNISLIGIECYPNPAHTNINFKLCDNFAGGVLDIYNMKGQLISSTTIASGLYIYSVAIADWSDGLYTYKLSQQNATCNGRFVKLGK